MSAYVVVIFGGPAGEKWCSLNHCPMEAVGPFDTHDQAAAEAARWPAGFQPHVLTLQPADWLAPIGQMDNRYGSDMTIWPTTPIGDRD